MIISVYSLEINYYYYYYKTELSQQLTKCKKCKKIFVISRRKVIAKVNNLWLLWLHLLFPCQPEPPERGDRQSNQDSGSQSESVLQHRKPGGDGRTHVPDQ